MDSLNHVPAPDTLSGNQADQLHLMRAMFGAARPSVAPILGGDKADAAIANPKIAIIDDEPINIKVVQKHLSVSGYRRFCSTTDAMQAFGLIRDEKPDVVLLDIMMPRVSGLEILERLRKDDELFDLPVVILTASTDRATKLKALDLGATDFLNKPVDIAELKARLRTVLTVKAHQDRLKAQTWELELEVATRSAEVAHAHREVVECLAIVGEYRDNQTGRHVARVGKYAEILARALGQDEEYCRRLRQAAALHDIGKVGIPDAILLKPGALDQTEWDIMRRHCDAGRRICGEHGAAADAAWQAHTVIGRCIAAVGTSPVLRMAAEVAHTHHERWDGTGYPRGLVGEAIPLEGRITAVADVFDALTSARPYKAAFSVEKSLHAIREGSGTHFDPAVVKAFFDDFAEIDAVRREYADTPPAA